jgi:hypothetical protein
MGNCQWVRHRGWNREDRIKTNQDAENIEFGDIETCFR